MHSANCKAIYLFCTRCLPRSLFLKVCKKGGPKICNAISVFFFFCIFILRTHLLPPLPTPLHTPTRTVHGPPYVHHDSLTSCPIILVELVFPCFPFGSRVVTHRCCSQFLAVSFECCDRFMAQGKRDYHPIPTPAPTPRPTIAPTPTPTSTTTLIPIRGLPSTRLRHAAVLRDSLQCVRCPFQQPHLQA